ncbi:MULTISPECIES: ABC transporter ATP-binding protein [Virgibacillus]|uniref:ABC transporter ATP-binding protein n=1 Tax=Virgibacillus salarius TaxID=447199 RepID=A0A941E1G7_9BACI|nr:MULTISPECIES: ABC transporter ATP-binding protein [Bacillaceae]MBR7797168.1 ABC transporter ATP-binding protein [Virgibacillus salarius]NAZ09877.1 ATP-binding cassette domain-containing protein [Agaribacter marinus]WBX80838.1 ABC transporter ATP-binding protein [Virgibacillus salarius]
MEHIIQVKSLAKIYGNQAALEDVNFTVEKGETFGFLGPSGAGKTTTIKILTGQLLQTSGEATVFGKPASSLNKPQYRREFGVITDNSGLYSRLSIEDNLNLYCQLYQVSTKRIGEVLEMVSLSEERKKQVAKLSKGMFQRVILARALLHKPALLFLDEPTSALDPANSALIHQGLRELNKEGTTIFLTTHDMNEAENICDRVAFLHQGRIQLLDQPKKLRRQFAEASVCIELKDGREINVPAGPEGAKDIYDYFASDQVVSIHSNEPTLGDIFVELTGRKLV